MMDMFKAAFDAGLSSVFIGMIILRIISGTSRTFRIRTKNDKNQ